MRKEDFGNGERRSLGGRKDFRENLFSVFIDNLNPIADVACLWSVFKVFGRVRDIFLSSKLRFRKSNYAFIRFDSKEEADRVAKTVPGMHVNGWPISSKLAEYGCNKRKSSEIGKNGTKKKVSYYDSDRLRGGGSDESSCKEGSHYQRSYVEIAKGPQSEPKRNAGSRKVP
ncbi:hypothetical protein Dsin_032320 [Dipteronia sinensis]|uniref:RRM domain-containing protein n=1 Tax=Dipteronia sinensis TaxID=43782 RepID=A0AAD9ZPG5_9ROSI|nr:hypothetical protein Dsin_032320 [Dipteronia sinensis]